MRIDTCARTVVTCFTALVVLCFSCGASLRADTSARVVMIADNQHVEDHGYSVGEQSLFADRFIPVARRPSLTNVFSLRILEYVLKQELAGPDHKPADLVIHLGDAINNGCVSEFREFSATMETHTRDGLGNPVPWYMAPGNHDSFFLGISHPTKEESSRILPSNLENKNYWSALCRNMRSFDRIEAVGALDAPIMTKKKFIKTYLSKVVPRFVADPTFGETGSDSKYEKIKSRFGLDLKCSEDTGAKFLHRVCWSTTKGKPWKGFVVQEVRVPVGTDGKVQSFILVDTCDYRRAPRLLSVTMFQGAGNNGVVSDAQLAIIETWLKSNVETKTSTTLVGHHPFEALNRRSLFGIRFGSGLGSGEFSKWFNKGWFDRYYSAHTHKGFSNVHQTNEDGSASFVEVNVGSLVDRPSEYVQLTLTDDGVENRVTTQCLRRPLTRRWNPEGTETIDPHCEYGGRDRLYNQCYKLLDRSRDRDPDVPDRFAHFPQKAFGVVQRAIYARIELRKDFASDKRGQNTHIQSLAQELFGYSSIFSAIDVEADLAKVGRSITPVCFRTYSDTCDASCEDGKHAKCTEADLEKWKKNRAERCRKASTLNTQCTKNFDVRKLESGGWVRTNGRVLDSSRMVRRYIHYYLSKVLSASRASEVCSGDRWDLAGICVGPYPLEIELARFNEAVKLFLQFNSGPETEKRNLCYALLSSNYDIVTRDAFNPHYD